MEYTVKLQRDSLGSPWGFRLQGGADLKSNLTVQRVSTCKKAVYHRLNTNAVINFNIQFTDVINYIIY